MNNPLVLHQITEPRMNRFFLVLFHIIKTPTSVFILHMVRGFTSIGHYVVVNNRSVLILQGK